jgi:hypothetical protein
MTKYEIEKKKEFLLRKEQERYMYNDDTNKFMTLDSWWSLNLKNPKRGRKTVEL